MKRKNMIIINIAASLMFLAAMPGCSGDKYSTYHHHDYDDVPPASMPYREYQLKSDVPCQTILGLGFEIQSDDFGPDYENTDPVQGIPYDLVPAERSRFAKEMLSGFRYMRVAMGLWFRGMTDDRKQIVERYPEQVSTLLELVDEAGVEGISMEYWSPAPYWKSTNKYVNGTLKSYDDSFLEEFSDALVTDLNYIRNKGFKVCTWGLQNEPIYEAVDGSYSHCHYSVENYVKTFRKAAPKIRAVDPDIEIIVDTNDGNVGRYGQELKKPENQDLLQYVDAWVYHRIGDNSDRVMERRANYLEGSLDKPIYQNEYEYFMDQVAEYSPEWRMVNTAQSIMNWMTFIGSQKWYWLHALKPVSDTYNREGFSLGYYRQPNSTYGYGYPDLKQGYFTYNPSNFHAIAGFLKYMPWNSVRHQVVEDEERGDNRIMAWKNPNGKFVIAVTNRSDEWFEFRIALDGKRSFTGHRYDMNNQDNELAMQSGETLTAQVKPWSIDFWVEQ